MRKASLRHLAVGLFVAVFLFLATYVLTSLIDTSKRSDEAAWSDVHPAKPKRWCRGDESRWGDTELTILASGGFAKYSGEITNTCRYPATIYITVQVHRTDGVKVAEPYFFMVGQALVIRPGQTVHFDEYIRLHDDPDEEFNHKYYSDAYSKTVIFNGTIDDDQGTV